MPKKIPVVINNAITITPGNCESTWADNGPNVKPKKKAEKGAINFVRVLKKKAKKPIHTENQSEINAIAIKFISVFHQVL